MTRNLFPAFAHELETHPATGYHRSRQRPDTAAFDKWCARHGITPPDEYRNFLTTIGPGDFFARGLTIFALDVVTHWTERDLPRGSSVFAIGYDGTTAGCYCLDRTGRQDAIVYWRDSESGQVTVHHRSFVAWIEEAPGKLFREKVYAGYRTIRDPEAIERVIRERAAFQVRLVSFERTLVRPPGHEKDFLPRHHHVVLAIRKLAPSSLTLLTVVVCRDGSKVGKDNREYVTLRLPAMDMSHETAVEVFAFDPFNVPFESIRVELEPEIDLGSPQRVRFAEIRDYL